MIGRDLVRLLQNVARIPEFELLWKDIIHNPQALSPQFTGEQAPRCALSLYVLSGLEGVEVNWQERFGQRKLGVGQTAEYSWVREWQKHRTAHVVSVVHVG